MALKSNYNSASFGRDIQRQADSIHERILQTFIRAGEEFVKQAREQMQEHAMGTYKDVTANLRNSIGYYIFFDGKSVFQNPVSGEYAGPKTEGRLSKSEIEGINTEAIRDIVNPRGFQLIAVAGMNYASHVESKGYNVISYQVDVMVIDLMRDLEYLNVIDKGSAARYEESIIPQ
jgi:hypothetical protein